MWARHTAWETSPITPGTLAARHWITGASWARAMDFAELDVALSLPLWRQFRWSSVTGNHTALVSHMLAEVKIWDLVAL